MTDTTVRLIDVIQGYLYRFETASPLEIAELTLAPIATVDAVFDELRARGLICYDDDEPATDEA